MIAAFRDARLEARIDPFLPERCMVFAEWPAFEVAAERSECVIAAFLDAGQPCSEDSLQRLGRLVHPPLILIMPLTPQALELAGRTASHACVALESVPTRLDSVLAAALAVSPRRIATSWILRSARFDVLVERLVHEILLGDPPVRSEADLSRRLGRSTETLRRHWNRAAGPDHMSLHRLVRWGRHLRALELLERNATLQEIAVALDVDESTIYRDFAAITRTKFSDRSQYVTRDALRLFRSDGPSRFRSTTPAAQPQCHELEPGG